MAVELAKLALWLDTVSVGHPLSFLDLHLLPGQQPDRRSFSRTRLVTRCASDLREPLRCRVPGTAPSNYSNAARNSAISFRYDCTGKREGSSTPNAFSPALGWLSHGCGSVVLILLPYRTQPSDSGTLRCCCATIRKSLRSTSIC
jgi:hypothetical protein